MDIKLLRRMAGLPEKAPAVVLKEDEAITSPEFNSLRRLAGIPVITKVVEKEVEDEMVDELPPEDEELPPEEAEEELPAMVKKIAAKAEGLTGDEMIAVIQQVYDAGFKDGKKESEEEEEAEEVEESASPCCMDSNGKEIKAGQRIMWKDSMGEHTGKVESDPKYNGGLKVGGRSVKNIVDDSDSVMVS